MRAELLNLFRLIWLRQNGVDIRRLLLALRGSTREVEG